MRNKAVIAYLGVAVGMIAACSGNVTESTGGTGSTGTATSSSSTGFGGNVTSTVASTGTGFGGGDASTVTSTGTGFGGNGTTTSTASTGTGTMGCPATAPADMSMCAGFANDVCTYGATECSCAGAGMGGPSWRCHTCPTTEPAAGSACTDPGATCAFGTDDCTCAGGKWSCGTCPATLPVNNSTCTAADIYCGYSGTGCLCTPGGGGMGGDHWRCDAPCPTTEPAPGTACSTAANMACTYGTSSCLCVQGQFFCN